MNSQCRAVCSLHEYADPGMHHSGCECLRPDDNLLLFLLLQPRHLHLLGIGARSLTGISLPLVSLTETSRGGGVLSLEVIR